MFCCYCDFFKDIATKAATQQAHEPSKFNALGTCSLIYDRLSIPAVHACSPPSALLYPPTEILVSDADRSAPTSVSHLSSPILGNELETQASKPIPLLVLSYLPHMMSRRSHQCGKGKTKSWQKTGNTHEPIMTTTLTPKHKDLLHSLIMPSPFSTIHTRFSHRIDPP